jgi:hypothetical protein
MRWTPVPEEASAYWSRRAKEQREAMEQAIKSGKVPAPPQRLASIYAEKRAEEIKAEQEQKKQIPAWVLQEMIFPPNDPITQARKQKAINGE